LTLRLRRSNRPHLHRRLKPALLIVLVLSAAVLVIVLVVVLVLVFGLLANAVPGSNTSTRTIFLERPQRCILMEPGQAAQGPALLTVLGSGLAGLGFGL